MSIISQIKFKNPNNNTQDIQKNNVKCMIFYIRDACAEAQNKLSQASNQNYHTQLIATSFSIYNSCDRRFYKSHMHTYTPREKNSLESLEFIRCLTLLPSNSIR